LSWAVEVVRFAEAIGAYTLVFHPESVKKDQKANLQLIALRNIKELQRNTGVHIGVETFGNAKRVLLPEEIGEKQIWMVLDTSHVFQERIFDLIERYHGTIAAVHLSEMREDEAGQVRPHLPVRDYGFEVLHALQKKGWHGTVTLEYLFEYHDQLASDREVLEALFS
jgi:sugar phosphate isomerase/epimerase